MRVSRLALPVLGVCALLGFAPARAGEAQTAQQIVAHARGAYDNVAARGLRGFRATVTFDWRVYLGRALTDDELRRFQALHYTVALDERGNAALTYGANPPAAGKPTRDAYDALYRANQLVVSGILGTWNGFARETPLPQPDGRFTLDVTRDAYRVSFAAPPAAVTVTMRRDFAMRELRYAFTDAVTTVAPQFQRTPRGLVLIRYHKQSGSLANGGTADEAVTIGNREVRGFMLPRFVRAETMSNGHPGHVAFTLSDYQLVTTSAARK